MAFLLTVPMMEKYGLAASQTGQQESRKEPSAVPIRGKKAAAYYAARVSHITTGIRHAESVYPYNDGIFVSNYGSEAMHPKKDERKAYIYYEKTVKGRPSLEQKATVPHHAALPITMAIFLSAKMGR